MHLGHRRANSYSSTSVGIQHFKEPTSPLIPPPAVVLATRSTADQNPRTPKHIDFSRGKEERRSFNNHSTVLYRPERLCRAYKGIAVSRATPPLVRFSVTPGLDWLDMNRPRSPTKAWKGAPVDAGVPALDQAFAAIREQLMLLKTERVDIGQRLDSLTEGIDETSHSIQRRHSAEIQRSPGQKLRRIRSLEGRAQSYIQLPMVEHDYPEFEEVQEFKDDSETISKPVKVRKRKHSLPSKIVKSVTSLSTSPVRPSAPVLSRKADNAYNRRSLQALETVIDNSSSGTDECFSPASTPQSSPKLYRVSSARSIAKLSTKVLVAPRPSRSSQTLYRNNAYNTLPCRKSSAGSPSYICDDSLSDVSSIPDSLWDECSLHSEGSTIFRISSATGQIEKVHRTVPLKKLNAGSIETLNSPNNGSPLRRAHQLSIHRCSSSEEPDLGMIMNLTEEPRPLSVCMEPPNSPSYVSTPKRNSIILQSIETTV